MHNNFPRFIRGDLGGFAHDWGHLPPAQLRELLDFNYDEVRAIAAHFGFAVRGRRVAALIDELVAYRAGWPRPDVGLH